MEPTKERALTGLAVLLGYCAAKSKNGEPAEFVLDMYLEAKYYIESVKEPKKKKDKK